MDLSSAVRSTDVLKDVLDVEHERSHLFELTAE